MKIVLLKIAAAAAGITLGLCIAVASGFWYTTRPKPPKPWNTSALTSSERPYFAVYGKELHVHLRYEVQNHTSYDYSVSDLSGLRVMGRYSNGSLSSPLEDDYITVEGPVFIPAQHTGIIGLELKAVTAVDKGPKQPDDEYNEQVRALLNKMAGFFDGFAVFDESNRYQLNLPKWNAIKPPDKPEPRAQP